MRTRSKGDDTVTVTRSGWNQSIDVEHNVYEVPWQSDSVIPATGSYAVMSDENKVRYSRTGYCSHYKRTINGNMGSLTRYESVPNSYYPGEVRARHFSCAYHEVFNKPLLAIPEVDRKQLNAEAYLAMKPTLSGNLNLTVFLAELTEVKSLITSVRKLSGIFQSAARRITGRREANLWELTKLIAEGHLSYSFGWAPFIGDLQAIYDSISNWKKLLLDYKSKQGIPQVRHYKSVICKDDIDIQNDPTVAGSRGSRYQGHLKQTYYATMRYHYTVPKIESEYAEVLALMDILGLKGGADVVWELIPFSFVVDWFVGVGNYLESRQTDYLDSKVTISDFCSTVKSEQDYTIEGNFEWDNDWFHIASVKTTSYERRRELPNASDFGIRGTDRYGTRQILLSASLLRMFM